MDSSSTTYSVFSAEYLPLGGRPPLIQSSVSTNNNCCFICSSSNAHSLNWNGCLHTNTATLQLPRLNRPALRLTRQLSRATITKHDPRPYEDVGVYLYCLYRHSNTYIWVFYLLYIIIKMSVQMGRVYFQKK